MPWLLHANLINTLASLYIHLSTHQLHLFLTKNLLRDGCFLGKPGNMMCMVCIQCCVLKPPTGDCSRKRIQAAIPIMFNQCNHLKKKKRPLQEAYKGFAGRKQPADCLFGSPDARAQWPAISGGLLNLFLTQVNGSSLYCSGSRPFLKTQKDNY